MISEPVPAGVVAVASDTITFNLTFGLVFSTLFQTQVCSQPRRAVCHGGVIVRETHRKEHFTETRETPESLVGVSSAEDEEED